MENKMYKTKLVYDEVKENDIDMIENYSKGYKSYIDKSKIEREAVKETIKLAKEHGFVEYKLGNPVSVGGKYFLNNRGKSIYLFQIGSENIENGIRVSAAHIDSPRLDLKQNPIYESDDIAYFKTHYYGGIKKYQWTVTPLALHGVVCKKDGTAIDFCVGESPDEPVFCVSDLLPHLAKDQMSKTMSEGISGEDLNIIIGTKPDDDKDAKDRVKTNVLKILKEKYSIDEEDFLSAELTCVPAGMSRDVGFDGSLIGSYGHDDKVCAYPAITALFENPNSQHTLLTILADKEEIGSNGNTGMKTKLFLDLIDEICCSLGANPRITRANSKCLSADVNSAYDPTFASCFEKNNSSMVGHGVVLTKFTGARGKSGSNDASAEYIAFIRKIFEENDVVWQTGELGKVDQGGGGTVATYIAEQNIETVDLGVAVLSMHAPFELISKSDLYMTHKAFSAFNK